ncbi:MAG: CotH kinase family protein [Bacteroidota bacterium]
MQLRIKYFAASIILILSLPLMGGDIDHWETILGAGSACRYKVPGFTVDPGWINREYDDSSWDNGPGGVGYGDGDDPTVVNPAISVYCRYHFTLTDPTVIASLILDVDFDDGFVAYLNGTELARYNMGEKGSTTSWAQTADDLYEATLYRGIDPYRVTLEEIILGELIAGDNVLAIEVHNQSIGSSDLSSNVYLHAGIKTETRYFQELPAWFYIPFQEDSTLLPLMIIDTEGVSIPNEPRITARMGLINNGPGKYNSVQDPFNEYDGQISIELRGESSLWIYPKNSYSIETQTDSGTNNNISLLGLPEENDFVLYGPYGDRSLIRNVITYRMYENFGHYSPRTRFIELVINDGYKGLYVLTEKIKRDKNRVAMAKITPNDTTDVDISGGYLLRVDKTSGMDPAEYWESPVQPPISGYNPVVYQNFDPDYYELTVPQRSYIKNHLLQFEQALVAENFKDPLLGYRAYLDIPSLIDLMILNEFAKDVDGFRLSHYFYKQKDTNGGKLVNGPPWDYNFTYGNSDYSADIHLTHNWTYTYTNTIYWWARVMQDGWFRNQLYCRWDELYDSVLSPESVTRMLDSTFLEIGDAIPRNFRRWPIYGVYVWPNHFVGQSYAEEEEYLRVWISGRLSWMNGKWGGLCFPVSAEQVIPTPETLKVYPNPSDLSHTFVTLNFFLYSKVFIKMYDMNGRIVFQSSINYSGSEFAYSLPDLSFLPRGFYTLEVSDGHNLREMRKLIKQ